MLRPSGCRYAGFMVSKSQRQVSREHTGRLARELSPSELSIAVRVASQGPRKNDLRMWREYAEATLFHAASLQPNHMAFIANGFARAEVPDREVFDRMSDHAFRKVDHFEPRDIALFLNAFARLQFRDLALFNTFSKAIRRSSSVGFGEQQLSLLCNAYARLEIVDTELFKKLSRWIARRAVELTPQGVATVANAYAKVLLSDETLFAALREGIGRNSSEFKAQHVANLLNAFARLELREERVALDKLASQIPNHARDFQPLELSQALHALVKLNLASEHRKPMLCLAEAIEEKAEDFHSRQLALTLHSFSMLNTSYGRLLLNLAPQVLSTLSMADHQSAAMVFCAYARAGQVNAEVLQALAEKLQRGMADAGEQMQVQLFYACGRFGLYKEPLTMSLAELLRQNVLTLSGQHLANCLLTLSRLSLCNQQLADLQGALQARLLRRDVTFEAQHLANSLYALAGIYGDGAPRQPCLTTPLPNSVVPRLLDEVVQAGSSWQQNPQLLASVAIASARLRQGSPELFGLVSETVRGEVHRSRPKLSKHNLSELLWSFAVSGFFDLDLFSWVLSQLDVGSLSSVPTDALLTTLRSLDYVSFSGQFEAEHQEGEGFDPDELSGTSFQSLLFLQCPGSFQQQALNFYQRVGLTLLLQSPKLPAKFLEDVAPAFARAGLLQSAVPFDLLHPSTAEFLGAAASVNPTEPPMTLSPPELKDTERLPENRDNNVPAMEVAGRTMSLMELFLQELSSGGSSSSTRAPSPKSSGDASAVRCAQLLARYAKLLPEEGASSDLLPGQGSQMSVPSAILDPLLRKMGAVLRDSARDLSFAELAETLATLADAGIRPTDVWEALARAAEACDFPSAQTTNAAATVASLLHGFGGRSSQQDRLHGFLLDLSQVDSPKLGARPLQTTARLLAALEGRSQDQVVSSLVRTSMAEAEALGPEGRSFEDLKNFCQALDELRSKIQPGHDVDLVKTLSESSDLLQSWLINTVSSTKAGKLLELLQTLANSSESRSGELLRALAAQLLAQSQVLGGAGLVFALQAFGRLRVLEKSGPGGVEVQDGPLPLPRLVASLMRSLLVLERRLSLSDAAKAAHFCVQAMDSPVLTEAERAEAKDGLARLLERLSWEQKRWSLEDRKLMTEVATLLRSEYPELLHSGAWVARSVVSSLEILR